LRTRVVDVGDVVFQPLLQMTWIEKTDDAEDVDAFVVGPVVACVATWIRGRGANRGRTTDWMGDVGVGGF
jgi:hypothetical protein